MKSKKVRCPACNTLNWSGSEYCQKCSGALYLEKEIENVVLDLKKEKE